MPDTLAYRFVLSGLWFPSCYAPAAPWGPHGGVENERPYGNIYTHHGASRDPTALGIFQMGAVGGFFHTDHF